MMKNKIMAMTMIIIIDIAFDKYLAVWRNTWSNNDDENQRENKKNDNK